VAVFLLTSLFVVSLSVARRRSDWALKRVNKALLLENQQRKRVEAYLDEAQELSRTGCFGWRRASGALFWSAQACRVLEYRPR
jgi:hypothetical protein